MPPRYLENLALKLETPKSDYLTSLASKLTSSTSDYLTKLGESFGQPPLVEKVRKEPFIVSEESKQAFESFRKGSVLLSEAVTQFPDRPIAEFLQEKGFSPTAAGLIGFLGGLAMPFPGGKAKRGEEFIEKIPKIVKKIPVPKILTGLEPLAQEARKYKSAEEFVKATEPATSRIDDIWYHQTDAKKIGRFNTKEVWLAPDDTAFYGENTIKVYAKPKNTFDLEIPENRKLYDKLGGEANPKTFDELRKMGYDSVKETNGDLAMLNPNDIKILSDSQLTDIWEKANAGIDPLIAEAKKYKSAEEFVKAQEITGINADFRNAVKFGEAGERFSPSDLKIIYKENNIPEGAKEVIIYRSAPGEIRVGDFVGLNKKVAEAHLRNTGDKIFTKKVSIDDLVWGNDVTEAIYAPKNIIKTKSQLTDIWNKAQFKKPSYGLSHRPSYEGMPPAYDLLQGDALPRDVYTHPDFSIASGAIRRGEKSALESWSVLQKIRGNPEAEITIYRASPKNELNVGDWVTFSKEYAKQSAEGIEKVHSFKVKAKDVIFAGDDINEFGYYPKK